MESTAIRIDNIYIDDRLSSLTVRDGLIDAIEPFEGAARGLDGQGRLAISALVDSHAHLDKTIIGLGRYDHEYEHTLEDCIENEHVMRKKLRHDPYTQACRYIRQVVPLGTLLMRSHVDVDPVNGVRGMEGVLRACEEFRDIFTAQLVAFPQSGLLCRSGTVALMDEALGLGADVVGGLDPTTFDGDARASVKAVFDLAQKHQKPVDFHLHEGGQTGLKDAMLIAEATEAYGMAGQVTLSHAFCLSEPAGPELAALVEALARCGIHVVTAATSHNAPKAAPFLAAGVNLCGGNDNMRDLWNPLGTGDMLERVRYIAIHNGFRREQDFKTALTMCTANGAALMGEHQYGLAVGQPADFVLLAAENLSHAAATLPRDRLVFRRGKMVAEGGVLAAGPA